MKESKSGGTTRQNYRKDQHHVDAHHLFLRVIELEKIINKDYEAMEEALRYLEGGAFTGAYPEQLLRARLKEIKLKMFNLQKGEKE